jgi:cytochrome c biogenesis protein CcmG, thiol:disulfide interchange protein DsbE
MAWGSMGFACAVLAFFTFPHFRQGEASVAGTKAENFAMELDGKPEHLSDLHGKVVVLNFWASWCAPCIEETPSLIDLQKRIASRNGVVLGVSVDEDASAYERFIHEQHLNYPTFLDPSKKIATDYGTSMWPETYIIDRKGVILRKIIGPQDWNSPDLLSYFDAILGQT